MSLSACKLIETADKAPFMYGRRAKELIGENIPNKGEILEELKLLAEVETVPAAEPAPKPVGDGAVEVLLQRTMSRASARRRREVLRSAVSDGSRGHERISAGLAIPTSPTRNAFWQTVARCQPRTRIVQIAKAALADHGRDFLDPFEGARCSVSDPCRFDVRAWVHTDDNGVTHVCPCYRVDPVIEANRERWATRPMGSDG